MEIGYGEGKTGHGPGVSIGLSGDELATAIDAYLVSHGVHVCGPRSVSVNGKPCEKALVYVFPEGHVVAQGKGFSGRGPK